LQTFIKSIESTGAAAPWLFVLIFMAASVLMIWRLEAMSEGGFEGTVLGTLVMPYCSGVGNLIFAFMLGINGGPGAEVMTNSLVNNVTNMTLILGVPALIWGLRLKPEAAAKKKKGKENGKGGKQEQVHQINRLSLLLTLSAVMFFAGATWALAGDHKLDRNDGMVLVGLFVFWQCFHVFEVLKSNVRQNRSFTWSLPINLALLGVGAYAIYISLDWLVPWITRKSSGFVSAKYLGWLTGWLMVLPNAILAIYYGWRGQPEVTYSSQVGDGHICIPLCVGIYALYRPLTVPAFFETALLILLAATAVHFLFVAVLGRLPRFMGLVMILGYGWFLYRGLPR
jgi:cation:H+ antiporter